jgi:hypothetical protein
MNHTIGISEDVLRDAAEGRLPKHVLVALLDSERRRAFLTACAAIEKRYTDDCTATNDPCLESGCAVEGEICLQPLLRSEAEYQRACGAEWLEIVRGTKPH